jgi:hypothetical protein
MLHLHGFRPGGKKANMIRVRALGLKQYTKLLAPMRKVPDCPLILFEHKGKWHVHLIIALYNSETEQP